MILLSIGDVGKGGLIAAALYALESLGVDTDRLPRPGAGFTSDGEALAAVAESVEIAVSLFRFLSMPIDSRLTMEGRLVVDFSLGEPLDFVVIGARAGKDEVAEVCG